MNYKETLSYFIQKTNGNYMMEGWTKYTPGVNFTTFYAWLFPTKISRKAFLCLHLRFELFWRKNIGANALIKCW